MKKVLLAALAALTIGGAAHAGSITIANNSNALVTTTAWDWKNLNKHGDEGIKEVRGTTISNGESITVQHHEKFTVYIGTNSFDSTEYVVWPDENWVLSLTGRVFIDLDKNLVNTTPTHTGGHGGGHVRHVDD